MFHKLRGESSHFSRTKTGRKKLASGDAVLATITAKMWKWPKLDGLGKIKVRWWLSPLTQCSTRWTSLTGELDSGKPQISYGPSSVLSVPIPHHSMVPSLSTEILHHVFNLHNAFKPLLTQSQWFNSEGCRLPPAQMVNYVLSLICWRFSCL